jgi:hypothetical protein
MCCQIWFEYEIRAKKMQSPNQICSALPPALAETPATPPYTTFLFSVGRPEFAFQAAIPLP